MNFVCGKCNKSLKSQRALDYHKTYQACKELPYLCKYCEKGFATESNMYRHMRTICKPKEEEAIKIKKKQIPQKVRHLTWNEYIGEDRGTGVCCCCKKTSISQQNFHCGHFISEKNGGECMVENLRPICAGCNLSMGSKNMDDFMIECGFIELPKKRIHKITQRITCSLCTREFASQKALDYHTSHNACNEYPYQCKYCEKKFTGESNMYRHMRTSCKVKIKKELCLTEMPNKNTTVVNVILLGYEQQNLSDFNKLDLIKALQSDLIKPANDLPIKILSKSKKCVKDST